MTPFPQSRQNNEFENEARIQLAEKAKESASRYKEAVSLYPKLDGSKEACAKIRDDLIRADMVRDAELYGMTQPEDQQAAAVAHYLAGRIAERKQAEIDRLKR